MLTRKAGNVGGRAANEDRSSIGRQGGGEFAGASREGGRAALGEGETGPGAGEASEPLRDETERLRQELEAARVRIVELERLADEDALIPIANRRAFVRELARMIAFGRRYGLPSSVIYFDVNGMKQINDAHGHLAGDAALRHIAKLLQDNIRASDIVGRLGGDEFGVILAQTSHDQASRKAVLLAEKISATPLLSGGVSIPVSAAFGVYSFCGGDDPQVAIDAADRAMYRQKRGAAADADPSSP